MGELRSSSLYQALMNGQDAVDPRQRHEDTPLNPTEHCRLGELAPPSSYQSFDKSTDNVANLLHWISETLYFWNVIVWSNDW